MSDGLSILWLKSGPLLPANTGGRIRTHEMLCQISREHRVTYLALKDAGSEFLPEEMEAPYAEKKIWISTSVPARKSVRMARKLLSNLLLSTLPYVLQAYQSRTYTRKIRELDASGEFDLIVCDFLTPALNVLDVEPKTPTVLFQHNMESLIWERMAANQRNPLAKHYLRDQFRRMFDWEERLSRKFDGIITVSPEDSEYARRRYGLTNVLGDVPTGVDTDYFSPQQVANQKPERHRIAFLGSMDWMPNIEAVTWFIDACLPLMKEELPDLILSVIGRNPGASLQALASGRSDVWLSGRVPDVRPHLAECSAMVVPLKTGGGTRIKILEAMALGVPVISTAIGAEGLGLEPETHFLLADSPEAFARQTKRLLEDGALRQRLSKEARNLVEESRTWKHAASGFIGYCHEVLAAAASPPASRKEK